MRNPGALICRSEASHTVHAASHNAEHGHASAEAGAHHGVHPHLPMHTAPKTEGHGGGHQTPVATSEHDASLVMQNSMRVTFDEQT